VLEAAQLSERDVPDFREVDNSQVYGSSHAIRILSDVPFAVQMDASIVEFYSR